MKKHVLIFALIALIVAPSVEAQWKPAGDRIKTRWAADVTPDNAWQEYPRPQMVRGDWQNLNGLWDYAIVSAEGNPDKKTPAEWQGKILVPFCIESSLSGVQKLLEPGQQLWYQRTFEIEKKPGKRTLLNFEAVDYECEVWVNGTSVGTHRGGNTPFKFDITRAAVDGINDLTVMVVDPTGNHQLRGKQTLNPRGIWYTRVSGIWQTVWIEQVPANYIERIKIDTEIDPASITVKTTIAGNVATATAVRSVALPQTAVDQNASGPIVIHATPPKLISVRVTASLDGKKVAQAIGSLDRTTVKIDDAKLWSPSDPNLYDLKVEVLAGDEVVNTVDSYIGLRKVGSTRDANGHLRFTLNGEIIFHLGPLDQGWWPDGLLTPPSDEAMLSDIQYLKDAGFNMIRSHIKVRPRRYYYHCDRLGMMMWQDQVSGMPGPGWTRMREKPPVKDWPEDAHKQYMYELQQMIDSLYNSPCIVQWVPFNEAWGQHRSMKVGMWTAAYDPTRQVNVASGGNFWPVGDVADHHSYPHPSFPTGDLRFGDFLKVVGEFGGHGFVVDTSHLWNPGAKNWGYGGLPKTKAELLGRYKTSIQMLRQLRDQGVAGGVYTQTTDVENEVNGLITYDREVIKFPAEDLARIHAILMAPPARIEVLMPTAREKKREWQYTTEKPGDDWMKADFDASGWKTGLGGFGEPTTPGSEVGTIWKSDDIWIRTEFDYDPEEGDLMLNIHYDEDPVVYINGVKAFSPEGFTVDYILEQISPEAQAALKKGKNTLAIYCKNKFGGQFIDTGLMYLKKAEEK